MTFRFAAPRRRLRPVRPGSSSRAAAAHLLLVVPMVFAACTWYEEPSGAGNRPPATPFVTGPDTLPAGSAGSFEITVHDPDGDPLRVYVAWGDGDTSDHGDFVGSGQTVAFDHVFAVEGTYAVSARCHDLGPLFSEWSVPLPVVALPPPRP